MSKIIVISMLLFGWGITEPEINLSELSSSSDLYSRSNLYMQQWGKTYFDNCFESREFDDITVLFAEEKASCIYVKGKISYEYGGFFSQRRNYEAYIYNDRTVFIKESKIEGTQECTTRPLEIVDLLF